LENDRLNILNMRNILIALLITILIGCNTEPVVENNNTLAKVDFSIDSLVNGSLVIVGGAMRDTIIFNTFIELAGGKDANIVIVPTAGTDTVTQEMMDRSKEYWTSRGVLNVTVLHTKDRDLANSDEFVAPIRNASGVWFTGGRQWRIADSYLGTLTQREFEAVLERGGVIGGSSAGATIQGSYLARGDTKANTIMMGDHEEGFAFINNVAIDQHLLKRNRQFDLVEILIVHPGLLGIGLDENTAIVVQGSEFEVIGKSLVAIYDTKLWMEYNDSTVLRNGGKFFFLSSGDKYNFVERKVSHWSGNNRQLANQ